MSKRRRRRLRLKPGTPPGMLNADPEAPKSVVRMMAYGPDTFEENPNADLSAIKAAVGRFPVVWVNVDGLGDVHLIEGLGEIFKLHRLALEDVVHLQQRPKLERFEAHLFMVAYMPISGERIEMDQLSLFLGTNFVVTFQVQPGDCLDPVRERIRQGRPRVRASGSGYLAYAILDMVVDSYYPIVETMGDRLEDYERGILDNPTRARIAEIHQFKRDLLVLRRAMWPFREVLASLTREDSAYIGDDLKLYLRDCQDHSIQLVDVMETLRESATSLVDLYLSSVSQRLNEVMKVLTIISTIFIPLSFFAGVWGMNFDTGKSPLNMPELEWYFGYPMAIGVMVLVAGAMIIYFKRKGWFD